MRPESGRCAEKPHSRPWSSNEYSPIGMIVPGRIFERDVEHFRLEVRADVEHVVRAVVHLDRREPDLLRLQAAVQAFDALAVEIEEQRLPVTPRGPVRVGDLAGVVLHVRAAREAERRIEIRFDAPRRKRAAKLVVARNGNADARR